MFGRHTWCCQRSPTNRPWSLCSRGLFPCISVLPLKSSRSGSRSTRIRAHDLGLLKLARGITGAVVFQLRLPHALRHPERVTARDGTRLGVSCQCVHGFAGLGLDGWLDVLRPILQQFVRASRGDVDRTFWRSIYKVNEQSGGPTITGWLTAFFPYLKDLGTGEASDPLNSLFGDDQKNRDRLLYPDDRQIDYRFVPCRRPNHFRSPLRRRHSAGTTWIVPTRWNSWADLSALPRMSARWP